MGNDLSRLQHVGRRVNVECDLSRRAPVREGVGEVRMVVVAIDYKGTKLPVLTSSVDAAHVVTLARACGVTDLTVKINKECTLYEVTQVLSEVASRVGPDDYFVFYFAGHGFQVEDLNGDEDDGMDEAFVLLNSKGKPTLESLLIDDDFAALLIRTVHPTARILVLADCCHSETIADLEIPDWGDREAVCIAAARDVEEAVDTDYGGVLTCSVLTAIAKMQQVGEQDYSVGRLFNLCLEADWEFFNRLQDHQHLAITKAAHCQYRSIAWPLVPQQPYELPFDVDLAELDVNDLDPHCMDLQRLLQ